MPSFSFVLINFIIIGCRHQYTLFSIVPSSLKAYSQWAMDKVKANYTNSRATI